MDKEIIVQSNDDETKVAVLENHQLVEFYVERGLNDRLVGNIFKGRVENVLPGMQAAFIDIGLEKNAFLYVDDVLGQGSQYDDSLRPSISDLLKEGQEVIVQVTKEPVGNKGPRVTRQMTLPGRYLVLMPNTDYIGISRRIMQEKERERLKGIADELRGENMGVIVRTVAEGASKEALESDLLSLKALWEKIDAKSKSTKSPAVVHKDLNLVKRILRDLVTDDVKKITVNSPLVQDEILGILGNRKLKYRVNLKEEGDLFAGSSIQQEIEKALKRKVWLKNGAYLVIDQTEALTSIDVNTGKFVGTKDLQDTVLSTNLEAAVEIARQIRLRNIGGIIIIDFIDMITSDDKMKILNKLEQELQKDKTKAHILGITQLGLVEMTRKKVRHSLKSALEKTCPYCDGKGAILSEETIALEIKEELREAAKRSLASALMVECHPLVAAQLIGQNGNGLERLNNQLGKEVLVRGKSELTEEKYRITALHNHYDEQISLVPVEENQIIKLVIDESHHQRKNDGVGRIQGFVIDVERAGHLVGQEVLVEVDRVYKTYAKAKLLT